MPMPMELKEELKEFNNNKIKSMTIETMVRVFLRAPTCSLAVYAQVLGFINGNKQEYPFLAEDWLNNTILIGLVAFYTGLLSWDVYTGYLRTVNDLDSRKISPNMRLFDLGEEELEQLRRIRPDNEIISKLYEKTKFVYWDKLRHFAFFGDINHALEGSLFSSTVSQVLTETSPAMARNPMVKNFTQVAINVSAAIARICSQNINKKLFNTLKRLTNPHVDFTEHEASGSRITTAMVAEIALKRKIEERVKTLEQDDYIWKRIKPTSFILPAINYGVYGATLALTAVSPLLPLFDSENQYRLGFAALQTGAVISGIQGCRDELWQQIKHQVYEDSFITRAGLVAKPEPSKCGAITKALGESLWTIYTALCLDQWLISSGCYEKSSTASAITTLVIFLLSYGLSLLELVPRYMQDAKTNHYMDELMEFDEFGLFSPAARVEEASYVSFVRSPVSLTSPPNAFAAIEMGEATFAIASAIPKLNNLTTLSVPKMAEGTEPSAAPITLYDASSTPLLSPLLQRRLNLNNNSSSSSDVDRSGSPTLA